MINQQNLVLLEGVVIRSPEVLETNGKKVMNFVVENTRFNIQGEDRHTYACVLWNHGVEKYGERLKEDSFVRITGHLQENVYALPDGKMFKYNKVCADHIEFGDD